MDRLTGAFLAFKDKVEDGQFDKDQVYQFVKEFDTILSSQTIKDTSDLEIKINSLTQQIIYLEKKIKEQDEYKNKINKIGSNFVDKFNCILSIRKTFKELISDSNVLIGGSLIRQLFELPVALSEDFKVAGYGNPIGRDIDIYLYENQQTNKLKIESQIKELNTFLGFHRTAPSVYPPIKFGNYELVGITDSTIYDVEEYDIIGKRRLINIPHYLFILKDKDNKQITIDILGWKPYNDSQWPTTDFDVNKLQLTEYGIVSSKQFEFDTILHHIINKEAVSKVDTNKLHNVIALSVPKKQKLSQLNQFIFFMTNRLKICGVGYQIFGEKIPDIYIEKEDACNITNIDPPYIVMNLVCGHKISIMAFVGIINTENDYSEAIKCSYCREQLLVKFIDKEACDIVSWTPPEIELEPIELSVDKVEEINMFSNESREYMSSILLKKTNMIDQLPSVPPSRTSTPVPFHREQIDRAFVEREMGDDLRQELRVMSESQDDRRNRWTEIARRVSGMEPERNRRDMRPNVRGGRGIPRTSRRADSTGNSLNIRYDS